jgi:hypothetical protein
VGSGREARKLHKRLHTHCTFALRQVHKSEKAPLSGAFEEPSSGLEPETPLLTHRGVTRVHARSLATQFLLQTDWIGTAEMRRETSRVSFLMCPFCVQALLLNETTRIPMASKYVTSRRSWRAVLVVGDRSHLCSRRRSPRAPAELEELPLGVGRRQGGCAVIHAVLVFRVITRPSRSWPRPVMADLLLVSGLMRLRRFCRRRLG